MNSKSSSKTVAAAPLMTAAEAVVATLVAHGLDAIYALPGLQNDPLFDALFRFSDQLRTILDGFGLDLPVTAGPKPALVATVSGPRGRVELR